MVAPPPLPELHVSRSDRWSLRWRMRRALRAGGRERRALLLHAARLAGVGETVIGVEQRPSAGLTDAGLRLATGPTLALGRCHRPTVARLADALAAGPVVLERIADHRHCWGVYLRTAFGPLALLASQVTVGGGGSGLRLQAGSLVSA